jgi:hypothetical protein
VVVHAQPLIDESDREAGRLLATAGGATIEPILDGIRASWHPFPNDPNAEIADADRWATRALFLGADATTRGAFAGR